MKTHLAIPFLFLLMACNVQAVVINEIMPNPIDENNEWIEIYNPGNTELNLSVWLIFDGNSNDSLFSETSMVTNSTYFLIIGENANISNITENNMTYFRTDGKIGSGLNNNGDNVSIHNSTEFVDNVSYPDFSTKEGYSWARMDNGSWVYSESPTPGEPNSFTNASGNETEENQTNNTCDLYLWIKCDEIFVAGSNKYYPMVEDLDGGDFEPEIEYWIEDMFGNIARSKFRTNNTNVAKSWTPPEITGTEAYVIHAVITNEVCNDTNLSNNVAEKLIVVKGEKPSSETECSCETETIEIQKPCLCGYASKEETTEKEEHFEIVSCPEEIGKDGEIEIKLNMKNPSPHSKNYTVYSYVYEGNKPVSLGLEGEDWINTWNANRQNLSIQGNSSLNLTLKNRIAEDTEPGKYKMRVRIWEEGEKHDITMDILIKEPARAEIRTIEDENKTELNESEVGEQASEIRTPTGRISSKVENWFSAFIESLINFFKNLFNL
ncbi:MAG: lamin tail domain-containing protein [Candidatus Aenigmatarchaeota archaeon]|nr:MAG: lamin tail domain-containing protein [Candidatus Aenigmarchaeota archaeon]